MTIQELAAGDMDELLSLYESVGWTNYTRDLDMLRNAYARSLLALGAWEDEKLVGAVRAVGDGCSIVFVQDLLVRPEYQRRGVGTALLRAVMERFDGAYQIELLTDDEPKTAAFYGSLGFRPAEALGCRAYVRMK